MGDSTEEWIDYIEDPDGILLYELHAFLSGDTVKKVDTFKADVSDAPRPCIEEKGLTAAEKKQAKGILDLCFISPVERESLKVISDAMDAEANYNGFQLVGQTEDSIAYRSPDGKKKKLKKEYLKQAVHYSHDNFSSYKLSGIVIDSFVYWTMGNWKWCSPGTSNSQWGDYERMLLDNCIRMADQRNNVLAAPGSMQDVDLQESMVGSLKVLAYMCRN